MRVARGEIAGMNCEDVHRDAYDAVGGISIFLAVASVFSAVLIFVRVHI